MSKPPQLKKKIVENDPWKAKTIFFTSIGRVIPPNANGNAVITEFYLDNNTFVIVVNRSFVFEHDFIKIENLLFKPERINGGTIYFYGVYLLVY